MAPDNAPAFETLLKRYRRTNAPVQVNFRRMVAFIKLGERATHLLHSYPAKLLTHIPHFFINNELLSGPGDLVLDPFCGSGTVLVEALLAGRNAVGCDTNPLACLISRVKTSPVNSITVREAANTVVRNAKNDRPVEVPSVVNLPYWFYPHVIRDLAKLRTEIRCTVKRAESDFLLACLSRIIRRVSLADPRLSVPVKLRHDTYPPGHPSLANTEARLSRLKHIDVLKEFLAVVQDNLARLEDFRSLMPAGVRARVLECGAQDLLGGDDSPVTRLLSNKTVQLIVTSPPYPGAQKYIRASSLNLGWLGLCGVTGLRALEDSNIGREHYRKADYAIPEQSGLKTADRVIDQIRKSNPLRAHIVAHYLVEMRSAFHVLSRILCKGGHLVLICGNGQVCGRRFRTASFLTELAEEAGLAVRLWLRDEIHSRGLMTKRNTTASVIASEYIIVLEKV